MEQPQKNQTPKVSVHILTWNSRFFIENLLESLKEQTFTDFSVLIIDNASTDGTIKWLEENYPHLQLVKNNKNKGFAGGHNQAIHFTNSQYVLLVNHDMILTKRYIERAVAFMDQYEQVAAVEGKVYKLIGEHNNLTEHSFTQTIDTTGVIAKKPRRFQDRGEGEVDTGQYNETEEVFGVSGALAMYRRSALEDVRIDNDYFDSDFLSYKEDVDIAWRLRLRGWQAFYVPDAVAYHYRSAAGSSDKTHVGMVKNRMKKSKWVNYLSNRNHLFTLIKNEQLSNFWLHFPWIFWYEIRKWGYVLFFEPKTLKGLWEFFKYLPAMRKKRAIIKERTAVDARDIRIWFK